MAMICKNIGSLVHVPRGSRDQHAGEADAAGSLAASPAVHTFEKRIMSAATEQNYLDLTYSEALSGRLNTLMIVSGLLVGGTYQALYTVDPWEGIHFAESLVWFYLFNQIAFALAVISVLMSAGCLITLHKLVKWPAGYSELPTPPKGMATRYYSAEDFSKLEVYAQALNFVWHAHNHGLLPRRLRRFMDIFTVGARISMLGSVLVNLAAAAVVLASTLLKVNLTPHPAEGKKPHRHRAGHGAILALFALLTVAVLASIFANFMQTTLDSSSASPVDTKYKKAGKTAGTTESGESAVHAADISSPEWRAAVHAAIQDPFRKSKQGLKETLWYHAATIMPPSTHIKEEFSKASGVFEEMEEEYAAKVAPAISTLRMWKRLHAGQFYAVQAFTNLPTPPNDPTRDAEAAMRVVTTFWRAVERPIASGAITVEEFFKSDRWMGRGKECRLLVEEVDSINWYFCNKHIQYSKDYIDGYLNDSNQLDEYTPDQTAVKPEARPEVNRPSHFITIQQQELVKSSFRMMHMGEGRLPESSLKLARLLKLFLSPADSTRIPFEDTARWQPGFDTAAALELGVAAAEQKLTAAVYELSAAVKRLKKTIEVNGGTPADVDVAVQQQLQAVMALADAANTLKTAGGYRTDAASPAPATIAVFWGELAADSSSPAAAGEALAAAVKDVASAQQALAAASNQSPSAVAALDSAATRLAAAARALAGVIQQPSGARAIVNPHLTRLADCLDPPVPPRNPPPTSPPTSQQLVARLAAALRPHLPAGEALQSGVDKLTDANAALVAVVTEHGTATNKLRKSVNNLQAARARLKAELTRINAARGDCSWWGALAAPTFHPVNATELSNIAAKLASAGAGISAAANSPASSAEADTSAVSTAIQGLAASANSVAAELTALGARVDPSVVSARADAGSKVVSASETLGTAVGLPVEAATAVAEAAKEVAACGAQLLPLVTRLTKPGGSLAASAVNPPAATSAAALALLDAVQKLMRAQTDLTSAAAQPAEAAAPITAAVAALSACGRVLAAAANQGLVPAVPAPPSGFPAPVSPFIPTLLANAVAQVDTASTTLTRGVRSLPSTATTASLNDAASSLAASQAALLAVLALADTQAKELADASTKLAKALSAAATDLPSPSCCVQIRDCLCCGGATCNCCP